MLLEYHAQRQVEFKTVPREYLPWYKVPWYKTQWYWLPEMDDVPIEMHASVIRRASSLAEKAGSLRWVNAMELAMMAVIILSSPFILGHYFQPRTTGAWVPWLLACLASAALAYILARAIFLRARIRRVRPFIRDVLAGDKSNAEEPPSLTSDL